MKSFVDQRSEVVVTRVLRQTETVVRRWSCTVEDRGTPTHPPNLTRHWGRWAEPVGGQAGMTDAAHPAGRWDELLDRRLFFFVLFFFEDVVVPYQDFP